MIQVRRANERGHFDHGWLDTYHTFSFADYHDPHHMGFRSLRVINEDRVEPGAGFGMHGHRDMEIITCVLEGTLQHKDSLGNGSNIRPGELQRMSAGTGIQHSEYNPSSTEPVHLYQIWLLPSRRGVTPSYEQRAFDQTQELGTLRLVASPDGADGSLTIHQDTRVYRGSLQADTELAHPIAEGRFAWVQVLRGAVTLNSEPLAAGDGAAVRGERALNLRGSGRSEVMIFDLA
jgi:redox-sensitive bicupin YhaK (pirin superfamily)